MKQTYPVYYPQFFTATILDWKHLLADDKHKDIIINSLEFLVAEKRIILNAFFAAMGIITFAASMIRRRRVFNPRRIVRQCNRVANLKVVRRRGYHRFVRRFDDTPPSGF